MINRRLPGAYVRVREEFVFLEGSLGALRIFSGIFDRILVVTNQQGIGKGLMSEEDLDIIHRYMLEITVQYGGKIDGVYYCPDLKTLPDNCRKPSVAMARQAQKDFPEIDFQRAIMVGDSLSDMEFGDRLGMQNILIETKEEEATLIREAEQNGLLIQGRFPDLYAFARMVEKAAGT